MTPKERLELAQNRLVERGVIDIKFAFNENVVDHDIDDVRSMIARILESYLAGEYKPMSPLNDRHLAYNK